MIGCRCPHEVSSLHAYSIRHQRAANAVSQEHPVLTLSHAKGFHGSLELDAIGFLGPSPAAVSPTLYLHSGLCHRGEDAMSVYGDGSILEIIPAGDGLPVSGIDVDGRHLCPIRQPIHMNTDNPSIRFLEVFIVLLGRKNAVVCPCDDIIDILVETQTRLLAGLNLTINIRHHILVRHLERGGKTFTNGGNRYENSIAHYLAICISEELVVIFVIELERIEGREDGLLLAHTIHLREVVGVGSSEVGTDNQLAICFLVSLDILQRIGLHPPVRKIDMQRLRERGHTRGIRRRIYDGVRNVAFLLEDIALVGTFATTAPVSTQHIRA